ncbi:MAG: Na/Pi cotransporter family protein [Ruminococcus sp.]|nr:Na/Pi cotransporter family protein [Ruminococcus sp.]
MNMLFTILAAVGGLALFIYGMNTMGTALEKASGSRLEHILDNMTKNIFAGVVLGVVVTAVIQSSSATTVIVVGLVNAGMLKLRSAIGIIMGANIGTTVTGQILRLAELDTTGTASGAMDFLKLSNLIPIILIIGMIIYMASKTVAKKNIGEIFLGLGVLFTGMEAMTAAVKPLAELPAFKEIFMTLTNPILGVLAGTIITAIIQSSSASVGILQAISTSGAVTYAAAFPIIMGQNIGTCITSILSAIGTSTNAKRAAAVHLLFNVLGTTLWLAGCYLIQSFIGFPFWDDTIDMGGIANFHTLFNITNTIIFLPFAGILERIATSVIRTPKVTDTPDEIAVALDERLLKSPSLAIGQSQHTVADMGRVALGSFEKARESFGGFKTEKAAEIRKNVQIVFKTEDLLNNYLVRITQAELTEFENRRVTTLMYMTNEFSRIADYVQDILENAEKLNEKSLSFSEAAKKEIEVLFNAAAEILNTTTKAAERGDTFAASITGPLEITINKLHDTLKARHIERLKQGECNVESGVVYLDILVSIQRIAGHCSNISAYVKNSGASKRENLTQNGGEIDINKLATDFEVKYQV